MNIKEALSKVGYLFNIDIDYGTIFRQSNGKEVILLERKAFREYLEQNSVDIMDSNGRKRMIDIEDIY